MQGDISSFVLNQAPPAENSEQGLELARMFVAIAKRDLGIKEPWEIGAAVRMWNIRWGSPFSGAQIEELIRIPPAPKKAKRHKPEEPVSMFPEFVDDTRKGKRK